MNNEPLCIFPKELSPRLLSERCAKLETESELIHPSILSVSAAKPDQLYAQLMATSVDFRVINCPRNCTPDVMETVFYRLAGVDILKDDEDYRQHSVKFQPLMLIVEAHHIIQMRLIRQRMAILEKLFWLSKNYRARILMAGNEKMQDLESASKYGEKVVQRLEHHCFAPDS